MSDTNFSSTPWETEEPDKNDLAHVWASDGDLVATVTESLPHGETHMDRARLIVDAAAAAEKAKEMGYASRAAVRALPSGLDAVYRAIMDLQDAYGARGAEAEVAAKAAAERLKVFMAKAGADESMIPGDASVALASAEGRGDE